MPDVTGAENLRVIGTPDGQQARLYRISQMSYPSADTLRQALASEGGKAVLADLDNFATGGATVLLADE